MNDDTEYVNPQDIDPEEDQNGDPIDEIEKNQDEEGFVEDTSKKALRKGIEGNDDNAQDEDLDEENY